MEGEQETMTLDDAIAYYDEVAEKCRRKANIERNDYMDLKDNASEAEQLADWLNELKLLRDRIEIQHGPCEDAVSRAELLSAFPVDDEPTVTKSSLRMTINHLPFVTPKEQWWIPCSERLPEEKEKSYWVCTSSGYQCQARWTDDKFGLGVHTTWGWHFLDYPQYDKITAWMPLPEPYKETNK